MTYLTGFFLVFAGMLIGYFLWYRDRSIEDQAFQELDREADDLRRGLKLTQQSKQELEERLVRQRGQMSVLQQLCEDWSTSREQSERERSQLTVEVEHSRAKFSEVAAEAQRLKKLQIELEDRLHQQTRQSLESASESQQSWQKKYLALELGLNQHQNEAKQSEREIKRLLDSLKKVEVQNAELKSEIATSKKMLETATKNVGGLKQEYVSLESSLKDHHEQLKFSRGETAAALSEMKQAQQTLADAQAQNNRLQKEADDLRRKLGSFESAQHELSTLKQSLDNNQQQLEVLTKQRDQALQSEKGTLAMAAGLQTRLTNQESTIHKLRDNHREVMEKLKYEIQLRSDLETTYEEHCKTLEMRFQEQQQQLAMQTNESSSKLAQQTEQLRKQVVHRTNEAKSLSSKNQELLKELDQAKAGLTKAKTDLQAINHEAAKLKAETMRMANLEKSIAELDAKHKRELEQSKQSTQSVESLRKEISTLKSEAEQKKEAEQQVAILRDELARHIQQNHALQEQARELEPELVRQAQRIEVLARELEASASERQEMSIHIDAVKQELAKRTLSESQTQQLRVLEERLKASAETIRKLRKERAGVMARLANYRTLTESEVTILPFSRALETQKRGAYDQEYGGPTRYDSARGLVYTEEPTDRDDLKLISGIAEVLEAKLNDLGVYTFKQIKDWTPAEVEEYGRLFHFKDRINREEWQSQAARYYQIRVDRRRAAA